MSHRTVRLAAALGLALACAGSPAAQAQSAVALGGRVSSAEEGAMEGVIVSATKRGSTITVSVVSDARGRFAFPADRLGEGHYALAVRAVGYELTSADSADIAPHEATDIELKLRRTGELASQLTSAEWLASMPGTAEQKRPLIECMSCHTLERVVRSRYGVDELVTTLSRMAQYANNTIAARVQPRIAHREVHEDGVRKVAAYLATVNLSGAPTWPYALRPEARPSGRATRAVVTEYALPRPTIAPHDVRTDAAGFVWYSNFVENTLGRLDPRTGAHQEWRYPELKPGFPTGALALEPDSDGNWWLAMMFQSGVAKFDVATQTFQLFPVPRELDNDAMQQSLLMPQHFHVDGKVWTNDVNRQRILRLDVATGAYESFDPFAGLGGAHSPYGMASDEANNLFFMDFADENVGRVDAKTGQSTIYPTPTARSRPRRTMMDAQGRLWFAEFAANKVAMFDPQAEAFNEWDVPPYTYPYDVFLDRNHELWIGSMSTDRVLRFDPKSGRMIAYLLPHQTNIRRVFVDETTSPVTLWIGNNHGAAILKLEPLD
jgi:virginiamycin B lyase